MTKKKKRLQKKGKDDIVIATAYKKRTKNMEATFESLGLSEAMLKALEAKGYGYPTTIQAEAIPHFMQWKDVIAKAPTGTGKTFAFGIPMIEHIDPANEAVQGLILAPTRELAIQIGDELRGLLTYFQGIRVAVLYGGAGIGGQVKQLERKPQIVVATPGRLMDHYNRKTIRLDKIQTVVLDEADRMLDMGFFKDVTRIIVNSQETYDAVIEGLQFFNGDYKDRVTIANMMTVFEEYNLFEEIKKAGKRKAWLKNGGYIVIDNTEALTAIDVNTGKYVGTTNLEDTVVNANIEAVEEIVRQVRLRNIGGIIIIDFIDMEKEEDREKVIAALEKELKKDRVKTNILGLTQLGLLEMTRKKTGHGLNQMMDRECGCCDGRGHVYNDSIVCLEIRHCVDKEASMTAADTIRVEAATSLIQYIKYNKLHQKWERECGKKIVLVGDDNMCHGFTVRPEFED